MTDPMTENLPPELWGERDAAVAAAHGGQPALPLVSRICEWLEEGGYLEFLPENDEDFRLDLASIARYYLDDDQCREWLGLPKGPRLTRAQRLRYARERVEYCQSELDCGPNSLLWHAVFTLRDAAGREVFLAAVATSYGQGGEEFEWHGVYQTLQQREADLELRNIVKLEAIEDFPDDRLLFLWRQYGTWGK